jgi:CRP-like cAMP-binding protein
MEDRMLLHDKQNQLLGRLPQESREQLLSRLTRTTISAGGVLCEPQQPLEQVHFPLSCVFSSLVVMEDGSAVEGSTTGNEGMVGVWLMADEVAGPHRIIQQVEGESLAMPASEFRYVLRELAGMRQLMARYSLMLLYQSGQNAACNVRHTVEERMARWLLTCADRAGKDELSLTQEFLSIMLGVRRQSVNLTAGVLQRAGFISYRRGGVKILDRAGLEGAACECYRVTREMYDRMLNLNYA